MPTPPGFHSCSYELRHSLQSRSMFLTFAVNSPETDPNIVATAIRTAFMAAGSLFSIIDSNVTLVGSRVSSGTDGAADLVGINTTSGACTKSLSSLPANCCALVHKRTSRGGRRGRGRLYIPFCIGVSDTTENGAITGAQMTVIQNGVNAWAAALTAGTMTHVLLHRPSEPGIPNPSAPGAPNTVLSMTVDPLLATQRRRLGR
jgi:hypothetical protein